MKRPNLMWVAVAMILILSPLYVEGSGGVINLPKTGQITSYATGDDGDLQSGVSWPNPRFTVSGDCVTDNLTGLMWVKSPEVTPMTWADALSYADTLTLCGHDDWRLPNINELKSLVHIGFGNIATWLGGQGFSNIQSNYYWTSSSYFAISDHAWTVSMIKGGMGGMSKTDQYFVLPVRGESDPNSHPSAIPKTGQITSDAPGDDGDLQKGVSWPTPRFSITYCDNTGPCANQTADCDLNPSNDIVRDNLTGLIWLRDGSLGGEQQWGNAISYANSLTLCGLSGWRLPNINERTSLMNFGVSNMAVWLNDNNFTNVPEWYFWTSSTDAATTANAWYAAMAGGAVSTIAKNTTYYAWPVKSSCISIAGIMISWWKGDDTPYDSIGISHGALMNGATFATGKVGKAFSLDGVDDYVHIPHKTNQNTGSQFTVEAWIRPMTITHGRTIIQKRSSGNVGGFTLDTTHDNETGQPANGLQFVIWVGGTPHTLQTPANTISVNNWHHVAAVYDGTNMKIFVDGVERASLNVTDSIDSSTEPIIIGRNVVSSAGFHGLIDEVGLYGSALTTLEIKNIYLAGNGGRCFTPDTEPDVFTFTAQNNVPTNTVRTSNTITVSGINSPAFIGIMSCNTSCEYRINDGSWTSSAGTVLNGDTVTVRQTSSTNEATTTYLILIIGSGGVSGTFSVTTATLRSINVVKSGSGAGSAIVTSIPSGMNCGGTCAFNYPTGSKVTLLFSPTPSWIQVGANPSISGTNALTIRELNADTTITVNFP